MVYMTELYWLWVLEARSLRPRWWFPLRATRRNLFHASLLPSDVCGQSLTFPGGQSITLSLPLSSHGVLACMFVSKLYLFIRTATLGLRAHLTLVCPPFYLTNYVWNYLGMPKEGHIWIWGVGHNSTCSSRCPINLSQTYESAILYCKDNF